MTDLCSELRHTYHLDTVQPEHPIRRAVEEIERLRAIADQAEGRFRDLSLRHELYVRKACDWHRRMQQAEAACAAHEARRTRSGGVSLGRALANSAACHYRSERDEALALLRSVRPLVNCYVYGDASEAVKNIDALFARREG